MDRPALRAAWPRRSLGPPRSPRWLPTSSPLPGARSAPPRPAQAKEESLRSRELRLHERTQEQWRLKLRDLAEREAALDRADQRRQAEAEARLEELQERARTAERIAAACRAETSTTLRALEAGQRQAMAELEKQQAKQRRIADAVAALASETEKVADKATVQWPVSTACAASALLAAL